MLLLAILIASLGSSKIVANFRLKNIYISESTSWRNRVPRIIDRTARAWLPFQIKLTSVSFTLGDRTPSKLPRFDTFVQR